jgi:DNA-binding NtrC family response regulator
MTPIKRPATHAMILLLCSEPIIREVMKEALEQAGYVVRATGDLGTAVDLIGASKIDLLITYPYVESISGHEAAKYLRGRAPHMGVLLIAGLLQDDRLQYRDILEKFDAFPAPFTADQLIEKVEEVLQARCSRGAHQAAGAQHRD